MEDPLLRDASRVSRRPSRPMSSVIVMSSMEVLLTLLGQSPSNLAGSLSDLLGAVSHIRQTMLWTWWILKSSDRLSKISVLTQCGSSWSCRPYPPILMWQLRKAFGLHLAVGT